MRCRRFSSADLCKANGWGPGTKLKWDGGESPLVIEITAVGIVQVLASEIRYDDGTLKNMGCEEVWDLTDKDWKPVTDQVRVS